jgi:site-specific recombinase XerD
MSHHDAGDELVKYLEKEQVKAILEAAHRASPRDGLLLEVTYLYGLRVSEAVRLKREDFRPDAGKEGRLRVTRSKGSRSGEYPLMGQIKAKLTAYLAGRRDHVPAMFAGRQGALSTRRVQVLFDGYATAAGVVLHDGQGVHCLRHSIAVHLSDGGADLFFIQRHLGHRDVKSTQIYAQISSARQAEVLARAQASEQIVIL